MNTVERRMSCKDIKDLAQSKLIAEKKCSKHRDEHYTLICYGPDTTVLDMSRKWLFEEELALHGNADVALLTANKIVLYINAGELEAKVQELRDSGY